jgi:cytochrome c-type biogenesis protein CcmF
MIPELGQFSLILALCLALAQAVLPLAGATLGKRDWMAFARPLATGQFVFVVAAFAVLANAFLTSDFSVEYVARNSNTALPIFYKFAAVWGGHEGSLLLWITILAIWTLAVAWASRGLPEELSSRVIGVLGCVSTGVIAFTLLTSNPFGRLAQHIADGNDLNPLLQDPAMVMHPPVLYTGYVGMAVPFAFAVAALLSGKLDRQWARWTRPWTVAAWMFLTVGIALGSWWAYYELGWGGWWFWDPVENSSFMPWLMGTALIHSLAVTERRGLFKSWTVLLAIAAFSLSLLGTFLVRSGVLISVHAFASDPRRGLFILALLGLISGGALTVFALRAPLLAAEGGFKLISREAFLLGNNILLVAATGAVLFGTIYPLVLDGLGLGKISVGPPYFNVVFLLPMVPLLLLVGVGMHTAWRNSPRRLLIDRLRWPAAVAIVFGATLPWFVFDRATVLTMIGTIAGLWVIVTALLDPVRKLVSRAAGPVLSRGQWGMVVAHCGVGIFVLGATITSAYNVELDRSVRVGESIEAGGYRFEFLGTKDVTGPNYQGVEGEFRVTKNGALVDTMRPQKRVYRVQQQPMTEAAIDGDLHRDVFVALGDSLGANAWSVRVQVKPLIRFIWLGALIMAIGGFLAATDRRYRVAAKQTTAAAAVERPLETAESEG